MSSSRVNPLDTVTCNGMVLGARSVAVVGASPWTLNNFSNTRVAVIVGGASAVVSALELSIDLTNFDHLGVLGGQFMLNPGDSLRVTYSVAPSVVYYPF